MSTEKPNWDALSEVQLKGSLVRRGLSAEGTKEEMVARLKNYETEESPLLMKHRMLYVYYVNKALRTVLVTPFRKEIMANKAFVDAMEKSMSYQIQKAKSGKSAVKLVFKDVNEGDAVYFQLKGQLSSLKVEVMHPANPYSRTEKTDEIDKTLRATEQYGDKLLRRTVILEKLPASLNTEEKLREMFPEAVDTVSFQSDPSSSNGVAILEFGSEEEVDEFIKTSGSEVDLEGETISVSKFLVRNKEFTKGFLSKKKAGAKEDVPSLSDVARLALIDEMVALEREITTLEDDKSVSGRDKVTRVCDLNETRKNKQLLLNGDTRRRLAAKETEMPEGEDRMLKCTQNVVQRAQEVAEKQTKEKPQKDTQKASPKKEASKSSGDSKTSKGKSPSKVSTSLKKKTAKVVSTKGSGTKPRPASAPGRGQNRMQNMMNYQRNPMSAAPGGHLLPDQRQALVRGRGMNMNRNMQQGMPGSRNQYGYNVQGQQSYQQMRGRQYDDAQAQIIVEGLTTVLSEKVRELEHIQHMQQGGGGRGHYEGGRDQYDERMLLDEFYQGGSDPGMGYRMMEPPLPHQQQYQQQYPQGGSMRGVSRGQMFEEREPYSNIKGRAAPPGRGYPRPGPHYESGYGRGSNW